MPHADAHGRWAAETPDRQACLEMLEAAAAGAALPYPFDDALRLAEAVCPPPDGRRVAPAGAARGMLRFLTWRREGRRMRRLGGEGSGGGGGDAGLPGRGVPA